MKKGPLKVGFDLDGVILYNPIRIGRPVLSFTKRILKGKKRQKTFMIPRGRIQKYVWYLLHKTSIFPARGLSDVKKLTKEGIIEPHIITGRYSFLHDDLERWLKRINSNSFIKSWHYNKKDEQPHLFKARLIDELGLDIYIEDNWDIVKHLNTRRKKQNKNLKVYWIYNIFDRTIAYPLKFPTLEAAVKALMKELKNQ